MPGYGFSGKPTTTGWDPARIGRAWVELMKRLGYDALRRAGRRLGRVSIDATLMAAAEPAPPELVGIHTNMPGRVPAGRRSARPSAGDPAPSGLSAEERSAYEQLAASSRTHVGYAMRWATRPQTLYGLADSPVGLAAFMLDHDDGSSLARHRPASFDGASGRATSRATTSSTTSRCSG